MTSLQGRAGGPPGHLDALLTGLGDERVTHILITHTHRVPEMVVHLYRDLPPSLHPAAQCSVLATSIHLQRQGGVSSQGRPELDACFELT